MNDLFICLNQKGWSILRGHSRYYSPWEHMWSLQDHRRVNSPEILIRGLIFIKFTSWWLCRSFCMYSWRELEISCPNLLSCRTALVNKTILRCSEMATDPNCLILADISNSFLALRQANPSLFRVPSVLHLSGAEGEWEKGTSCCSFPSFVPHPRWHGFPWRCSWHWEGRSWAEQFPG